MLMRPAGHKAEAEARTARKSEDEAEAQKIF